MAQSPDGGAPPDDQAYERSYQLIAVSAVSLMVIATVVYRVLEGWSWVDSLYFSVVAVTTVGFGDLSPTTDASKLFTVFYVLAGIGLVTTYINLRTKRHAQKKVAEKQADGRSPDSDSATAAEGD